MKITDITFLKALKNNPSGTLLEWKDSTIFISKYEQVEKMIIGESYLVMICFDEQENGYFASEKFDEYLNENALDANFNQNDNVSAIVCSFSPLGANVAVNLKYKGLIYKNEIFKPLNIGDTLP